MDKNLTKLKAALGARLRENEPLARYTTFKIGGPADYFYEAQSKDEFAAAVSLARETGLPLSIIGGGTNLLIGDKGIRGIVIKNSSQNISIRGIRGSMEPGSSKKTVFVEADAGVPMNKLVRFTIEEGLSGLEMQLGLPGSVGGAVYMNSKWTKPVGYVGDCVYQAEILTPSGEVKAVTQDYFHFAYDYSILQKTGDIVLSVTFALLQDSKEKLWETANTSIGYRRETQPQGVFSAGCTFKNISKAMALTASTPNLTTSAGFLVDNAGLKGKRLGDAEISPVHANFIVNRKNATAADVVELIELARNAVKEKFGVDLEEEIIRIGEF
ncbi:UDP-N-acetylmuramate dehydrogenase [Candidatus Gottesmanbacteria bacterium]|nr:UDP-N-acetylmuramate dehydrogenase [Candidatus Gottesmanbacteria bacterium]